MRIIFNFNNFLVSSLVVLAMFTSSCNKIDARTKNNAFTVKSLKEKAITLKSSFISLFTQKNKSGLKEKANSLKSSFMSLFKRKKIVKIQEFTIDNVNTLLILNFIECYKELKIDANNMKKTIQSRYNNKSLFESIRGAFKKKEVLDKSAIKTMNEIFVAENYFDDKIECFLSVIQSEASTPITSDYQFNKLLLMYGNILGIFNSKRNVTEKFKYKGTDYNTFDGYNAAYEQKQINSPFNLIIAKKDLEDSKSINKKLTEYDLLMLADAKSGKKRGPYYQGRLQHAVNVIENSIKLFKEGKNSKDKTLAECKLSISFIEWVNIWINKIEVISVTKQGKDDIKTMLKEAKESMEELN